MAASINVLWGFCMVVLLMLVLCMGKPSRQNAMMLPLPPGPPGEPILGHLRIIPKHSPQHAYIRWSKEYQSDILSFKILGQPIVVLNSARAATELLDKKGANYSDRPRFVLFEVMGWHKTLTFLPYGPDFRLHRRILQKSFLNSNITQYRPLQEEEMAVMLRGITEKPGDWEKILRRFATAVVLGIGFGIRIRHDSDPLVQAAADASYVLSHSGAPAGTPVDYFPTLRFLPSMFHDRSLRFANEWRWAIRNLHDKPFDAVISATHQSPSLVRTMLQHMSGCEKNDTDAPEVTFEDIKGAAGAVFAAGQDTTWSTLTVFVLNMVLHPEIQSNGQHLLDEVVGRSRLPTFEDRPKLRYVDYIVQEMLRWCPVSPVGITHRSTEDDVFEGYRIPAGSYVLANARAMTHDDTVYTSPEVFDPDRYIPVCEGGRGEPFPVGQFGFGRRICVGKHLAEASLWIVVASFLSTMTISKAKNDQGMEIIPEVEFTDGLTCHPRSFPCAIAPRDEESRHLLQNIPN